MAYEFDENELRQLKNEIPEPRSGLPREIYQSYLQENVRLKNRAIFFKRLSISVSVCVVLLLVAVFGFDKFADVTRDAAFGSSNDPIASNANNSSKSSSETYNIDIPNAYHDSIITVDLHSGYDVDPNVCYIIASITIKLEDVDKIEITSNKKIEDYLIIQSGSNPEPKYDGANNMIEITNLSSKDIVVEVCFYPKEENAHDINLTIKLNDQVTNAKLN